LQDSPEELVRTVALAKASALLAGHTFEKPTLLITSDQVVTYRGQIREKPESKNEAREFVKSYGSFPCQTVGCILVTRTSDGLQHFSVEKTNIVYTDIPDSIVVPPPPPHTHILLNTQQQLITTLSFPRFLRLSLAPPPVYNYAVVVVHVAMAK
jgi:hypothetical protein